MSKTSAVAAKALTSNHFELFGLVPAFALDPSRLDAAYRDIQSQVHPDRYAHAGDAERRASMQMTTRVNEAYRTLKDPVERGKYLLELHGVGELELVGHAGATGGAHAQAQRHALAALGEVGLDVAGGFFGQGDGHGSAP